MAEETFRLLREALDDLAAHQQKHYPGDSDEEVNDWDLDSEEEDGDDEEEEDALQKGGLKLVKEEETDQQSEMGAKRRVFEI